MRRESPSPFHKGTPSDVCAVGKSLAFGYADSAAEEDAVTTGLDEVTDVSATEGDVVIRINALSAHACSCRCIFVII